MGGNYSKSIYNQLMDVMDKLEAMESECKNNRKKIVAFHAEVQSLQKENSRLKVELAAVKTENSLLREENAAFRKENQLFYKFPVRRCLKYFNREYLWVL